VKGKNQVSALTGGRVRLFYAAKAGISFVWMAGQRKGEKKRPIVFCLKGGEGKRG